MASGCRIRQLRSKTFLSLQKVYWDSTVLDNTLSPVYMFFSFPFLKESVKCRGYHNCTDMGTEAQGG